MPGLDTLLTEKRLRILAGYAFARGEAYLREGRVMSVALDGNALTGVVSGTESYQVQLLAWGSALVSRCTCPVGDQLCKHAVALGLAYLARAAPIDTESASTGEHFATRDELEAWVGERGMAWALALSAENLAVSGPRVQSYGLQYLLGRLSLKDLGSLDGAQRHAGAHGLATALAEAAHRLLHEQAAIVEAGIAEEAQQRSGDSPLSRRLLALRDEIRPHAPPRSRAWRATGNWKLEPQEPAIIWKERERVIRSTRDYGSVGITTRLTSTGGRLQLDCTCTGRTCVHALALVDATLDVLDDPARREDAERAERELLRPSWSRALEELALLEAKAAAPRPAIEVWWRVEYELGTLALSPIVKKQLKRGGWSSGAQTSAARLVDDYRDVLGEHDLRIAEHYAAWVPGRGNGTYPSRAFLALVGHPRVVTELSGDQPIEVKRAPLGFTALPVGDEIRLEPSVEGVRMNPGLLAELLRVYEAGEPLFTVDPETERCLLIDVADEARQLWAVLEKHGDAFPPESHAPLLERLARMEGRMPLVVPQSLKGRELPPELTTVVRMRLLPDVTLELELFTRVGRGAPMFHPGAGPRDVLLERRGERGYVRRDLNSEKGFVRATAAPLIDGAEEGPPGCFRISDPEAALVVVAAAQDPPAGLEIEWLDQRPYVGSAVGPEALRVQVERKRDWFGLDGDLKIESGRLELAVLVDAARRQQRFVRVDEQRWVELSDTLRQRLQAVADQTYVMRDRLEVSPGGVPAIQALVAAGAKVKAATEWEQLTERLAASQSLRPKVPATLDATLRDYQVEGHAWLSRIAAWGAGACLADDMGLGKTVQAIAVLLDRAKHGPALVLAPTSVAFNWVQELARFAPTLRPVLYAEQADRAKCLATLRKKDVLIASYGLLVRDAALLASRPFATLVVDEAQALKNATTRRAKAARALDAGFRIALTGTPLENHLGDLWSLFAIVFPGLLGSWDQFRDRFAIPIERTKDPAARAALSRVLRPFLLRRTKQEVARELPARTEILVPVALSHDEWAMYEDARLAAVVELSRQSKPLREQQRRFQVLAALTRLRLLASHPRLYDPRSALASSKMKRLLELLDELRSEGHRALVFSQFTSHLALVREELERAGYRLLYLDGATPAKQRAKLIAEFQAGGADAFLISLKAGGTGINLTAADYVIHLDPWWNPAVEDQATDRAHRIGQTKPVTVYRLVSHGTIEDQIMALHKDKRALVAGILEGTDAAARLTTKDLLQLLESKPELGDDD